MLMAPHRKGHDGPTFLRVTYQKPQDVEEEPDYIIGSQNFNKRVRQAKKVLELAAGGMPLHKISSAMDIHIDVIRAMLSESST